MPALSAAVIPRQYEGRMDAIALLEKDHRKVEDLFRDYRSETPARAAARQDLFRRIKQELDVHARIEEKLFYPALRSASGSEQGFSVDDAVREHGEVDRLLGDISRKDPGEPDFDRAVKDLQRAVEKHVDQEESQLFPRARKALPDDRLVDLGRKMDTLKKSLNGGPRFRQAG